MGRCIKALVLKAPVTGIKPSILPRLPIRENVQLVAWYSAILHANKSDVKFFLDYPGTSELANIVNIVSGDVGSSDVNVLPSEVHDVVRQTLVILSRTANLHPDHPIAQLDIPSTRIDRIVVSGFRNLIQRCIQVSSTFTSDERRGCLRISLKCLWYYAKAYQILDASEQCSAYFFSTLGVASPEFIHLFQSEQDRNSRVMGRCMGALAVMKLMAEVRSNSDLRFQIGNDVLACLSTILNTESDDMKYCLECPDAVELATIASLVLGDFGPFGVFGLKQIVEEVVRGTYAILCKAPPTEDAVGWGPFNWTDIFNGSVARLVVSNLNSLFQTDMSGTSGPTANVRRSCLRMCLRSLCYCAKAYHQPGVSSRLPLYSLSTLASPEIIRLIHVEKDPVSRATGCCFIALVVAKLAADIRSRTDSKLTISDDELTWLPTILGTKSSEVGLLLERPGVIELVSMVSIALGVFGSLDVDALPLGVRDVAQQTLAILSQTARLKLDQPIAQLDFLDGEFDSIIVSGFHNLLYGCILGISHTSPEVRKSCLRMSLDCLWYCAKAYHQPGASKPLPSYFPNTLASPEIIRLIHVEQDPVSRVTGRCFGALVSMKLAVDIRSRADLNVHICDEELECLSAILGTESPKLKILLSRPCAIELATIISLISSEIGSLFSDTVTSDSELLDMVQQTCSILTRTLPAELNVKLTNFTEGRCEVTFSSHLFGLNLLIRDLTNT